MKTPKLKSQNRDWYMGRFLITFMVIFTLISIAVGYLVFFFWLLSHDRWILALIVLILPISLFLAVKTTIDSLDNK